MKNKLIDIWARKTSKITSSARTRNHRKRTALKTMKGSLVARIRRRKREEIGDSMTTVRKTGSTPASVMTAWTSIQEVNLQRARAHREGRKARRVLLRSKSF